MSDYSIDLSSLEDSVLEKLIADIEVVDPQFGDGIKSVATKKVAGEFLTVIELDDGRRFTV